MFERYVLRPVKVSMEQASRLGRHALGYLRSGENLVNDLVALEDQSDMKVVEEIQDLELPESLDVREQQIKDISRILGKGLANHIISGTPDLRRRYNLFEDTFSQLPEGIALEDIGLDPLAIHIIRAYERFELDE